jgi:cyclic-di-GMP-binding protein
MKSALRLFRDLLPFSQPQADRKAAEVRELLDTVAGLSSYEVVTELTTQVIPAIVEQQNLHMRFKLLEDARQEAEKALPVLERHIDYAELPLPLAATTSALAADNLMKALANAYFNIAKGILEGNQHKALSRMFQRTTLRAMSLLARRQQLAYRTYAKPSSSSWIMLHELYQMARSLRVRIPGEDIAPIEHQYLSALLFAYLEPSKLPRIELATAIFCTQQLAGYAVVAEVTPETNTARASASSFIVHPEEGSPGTPLQRVPHGTPIFDGMIIDCSGVLNALDESVNRPPEVADEPGIDIPPALVHALQLALGGRSVRRFARKRFKPHADLVGGIAQVIPFIEGSARARRSADAGSQPGARHFVPSEWSLIDQSPDGFLVRFIQGENWKVGVGNIVALQPRESSKVHVCMVRRIATNTQGRLELGLQALSPQVSVVDLPGSGELRRAIYLHRLPAYGDRPGIVARPGQLASGQTLNLAAYGKTQLWQIGRRLEASDGLEFFALVPL